MWGRSACALEVAITWPWEPTACTAIQPGSLWIVVSVSKPVGDRAASRWSLCGLEPPSTRQEATWVAPFQLAYTLMAPPGRGVCPAEGAVAGCPLQGKRYAR